MLCTSSTRMFVAFRSANGVLLPPHNASSITPATSRQIMIKPLEAAISTTSLPSKESILESDCGRLGGCVRASRSANLFKIYSLDLSDCIYLTDTFNSVVRKTGSSFVERSNDSRRWAQLPVSLLPSSHCNACSKFQIDGLGTIEELRVSSHAAMVRLLVILSGDYGRIQVKGNWKTRTTNVACCCSCLCSACSPGMRLQICGNFGMHTHFPCDEIKGCGRTGPRS